MARMLIADKTVFSRVPVYKEKNGLVWVPLEQTAEALGLHVHDNHNQSFAVGATDPAYTINTYKAQALAGDNTVNLPQVPRVYHGKPYMTVQSLSALTGIRFHWDEPKSQITMSPADERSLSRFLRQPGQAGLHQTGDGTAGPGIRSLSAAAIDKDELIRYAKTFMGTPYDFASGAYESTGKFDCSSFIQHVYEHFGVDLPRSSRSQAEVGQTVATGDLQPGDLMFFYTPGRYESNRIVGHVGIYAGNGQIIHTYGEPGVTLSEFSDYWKKRLLFSKRVAG